ncbi:BgTH12-07086 [Blumeria graminis f. sp. triticale]|uniref:BgTH12-07086 n=1 Tax=Blumeria graminis f. sp. triticale TaxID=1689686 RepID=A0A9W4DT38_BLUGR|nr:BgTH12-07086 [Blumeria graminis f. sp. triticale]
MTMRRFIRFTQDPIALEKMLRLFQSFAHLFSVNNLLSPANVPWHIMQQQFSLGRRYLRFFRFTESFAQAYDSYFNLNGVEAALVSGKWSFYGLYLACESLCLLDAMQIWETVWAKWVIVEGYKFWSFSLVCSISWGVRKLWKFLETRSSGTGKKQKPSQVKTKILAVSIRIVIDGLDLVTPGMVLGWLPLSANILGLTAAMSTILSLILIWNHID